MSLDINTANYGVTQSGITAKNKCETPSFGTKGDPEKLSGQPAKDTIDLNIKTGLTTDNANGAIGEQDFTMEAHSNLLGKRTFKGTIGGKDYNITSTNKGILGTINGKPVNIEFKTNGIKNYLLGKYEAVGSIGDDKINLKLDADAFSRTMEGTFKGEPVDMKFSADISKSDVRGTVGKDDVKMKFASNGIFKNGFNVKGSYNADPEFLPILMSTFYANESDATNNAMAITATI